MTAIKPALTDQLIFQVVGYKNTGKTTMVCRLTELFKYAGYMVGTIKRDAHDFQLDTPGTDTWKHLQSGADLTAITSSQRTAIFKQQPATLSELISQMSSADVVIIEGFKTERYPKIVLIRSEDDLELLNQCTSIIAIAAWPEIYAKVGSTTAAPLFSINQTAELFELIKNYTGGAADFL